MSWRIMWEISCQVGCGRPWISMMFASWILHETVIYLKEICFRKWIIPTIMLWFLLEIPVFFGSTKFEANGRQYLSCDGCWVLRRVWTFYDAPKWCTTSGHKQWKMFAKSAVRTTTPWLCHLTGVSLTSKKYCFWWNWGCFVLNLPLPIRSGWIFMEWKGAWWLKTPNSLFFCHFVQDIIWGA